MVSGVFLIGKYDSNKNGSEGSRGTVALGWGLSSYLYKGQAIKSGTVHK